MNIKLLELSLERARPADWEKFERLCSCFLVSEFSNLRTMAAPAGDGGRDSELFYADNNPLAAIQYSVSEHWEDKIRKTIKRLKKVFPNRKILIYLSNQQIGASADNIKKWASTKEYYLDVRDRNWFIERANYSETNIQASQILIDEIARPYLSSEKIIESKAYLLNSDESKAAFLYLGFQIEDDVREKGITKLSYEAIVRSVLRNTDSNSRLTRKQIYDRIYKSLPCVNFEYLQDKIDSALHRLTKRYIRHWQARDEFCLTNEETERLQVRLAERELDENAFDSELRNLCKAQISVLSVRELDASVLCSRVRRILERYFLDRGESFASSIASGNLSTFKLDNLFNFVLRDIEQFRPNHNHVELLPHIIETVISRLLFEAKPATQKYLHCLSNTYALFASLCMVPDVQKATKKIFSHGEIWLDTTVILPILSEILLEEKERYLSQVLSACHAIGIPLKITHGVLTEINAHMDISLACSRRHHSSWQGRIPFLYSKFLESGKLPSSFNSWIELFRGTERQMDDIEQHLSYNYEIHVESLDEPFSKVDPTLRYAVSRLWRTAHEERRSKSPDTYDHSITDQLIQHDVENYLGMIGLRLTEKSSELSFKHWWLTFDNIAWQIRDSIIAEFKSDTPPSPLISLDFLVNFLSFNSSRNQISYEQEASFPFIFDTGFVEFLPQEFLEIVEKIRNASFGLPDYIIRRRIRDAIDKLKRDKGIMTSQQIMKH